MKEDDAAMLAEAVETHLRCAGPLLVRSFGRIPLLYLTYPDGFEQPPVFHYQPDAAADVETVEATTSTGVHRFAALTVENLTRLARTQGAVSVLGWSPLAQDSSRAAFGRITLERNGAATSEDVVRAARLMRERLESYELQAIFLTNGSAGATLWIPLTDGPGYPETAEALRAIVAEAEALAPLLLTTAARIANRGDRVYLGTHSNHPGMATALPYQIRGRIDLPVDVPLRWSELAPHSGEAATATTFEEWLARNGDLFAELRASIGEQRLPAINASKPVTLGAAHDEALRLAELRYGPSMPAVNSVLVAALQILADGNWHTADEILSRGVAQALLPAAMTRKYVYTALYEYIVHAQGLARKPKIVESEQTHAFRLNEPIDAWPAVALAPPAPLASDADVAARITALRTTATGDDPAAFEQAVCDAFALLGFAATHIGGHAAPDGTLDAPLGLDGYRVVVECKTASPGAVVNNPRPEEPAGFRDAYRARYALVIGPAFSNETTLDQELMTHGVSLWTVDDLAAMLTLQADTDELRAAFKPGRAADACDAMRWERDHGRRKRIASAGELIVRDLWALQVGFAGRMEPARSPIITREVIAVLLDRALIEAGVVSGIDDTELTLAIGALLADSRLQTTVANPAAYVATRGPAIDAPRSAPNIVP